MKRKLFLGAAAIAALAVSPAVGEVVDAPSFNIMGAVIVWAADENSGTPIVSDFIIDSGSGSTGLASGDADLIAGDVHTVVTGSLIATKDAVNAAGSMPFLITNTSQGTVNTDTNNDGVLTAADSFSAFGLQANSDTRVDATETRSSFYVASNTPFSIDAQTFVPGSLQDLILLNVTRVEMSVMLAGDDGLPFGARAQYPHSGGATAGFAPQRRLRDFLGGRRIFTGNQQTALTSGSIAEQSVRFDAEYSIRAQNLQGYDLSLGTFDFEVDVVYTVFVP